MITNGDLEAYWKFISSHSEPDLSWRFSGRYCSVDSPIRLDENGLLLCPTWG